MLSAALVAAGALVIALARWLQPIRPLLACGLIVVFTFIDLWAANGPNTSNAMPPQHYEVLKSDTDNETIRTLKRLVAEGLSKTRRDRVELVGLGFHWPNASLTHELENTLGYNPMRLKRYEEATRVGDTSAGAGNRHFSALLPSYRWAMADLLGLRFIATGVDIGQIDPKLKDGVFRLIATTKDGFIYENPHTLPRVLYASEAYFEDFDSGSAGVGASSVLGLQFSRLQFSGTVLLHRPGAAYSGPREDQEDAGPERSVRIVSYANSEVVIEANGPGGFVVLNDIWHPWWFADLDGEAATIERANFLFRAVAVPPGRHRVRFTFRPVAGVLRELSARLSSGNQSR